MARGSIKLEATLDGGWKWRKNNLEPSWIEIFAIKINSSITLRVLSGSGSSSSSSSSSSSTLSLSLTVCKFEFVPPLFYR